MSLRIWLCLACVVPGVALLAQTPSVVPSGRQATERLNELRAESDRLVEEARTLLADLRALEAERDQQTRRLAEAQASIAESQAAVDRTAQRMLSLEAERITQLPAVEAQLVDMYKQGRVGYTKFIFSAGSMREFSRAARAVAAMLDAGRKRVAQHRATLEALAEERRSFEQELEVRRAREAEARQARTAANRAITSRNALLEKIDAQRDINAQLAGELQLQQAREPRGVGGAAAANAPVPPDAAATIVPAAPTTVSPLAPLRGRLLWPVSGRITGRFGRPLEADADPASSNGVEIASRAGNPVRALHDGTVSFAGSFGRLGNVVIVDHGGSTLTLYGYLDGVSVGRGDVVSSGARLGRVGLAPSGEAVLFLEIRIDGRSVDPVQWLSPL